MSMQAIEQLGSRQISRTQGKLRATRSFHVWDETSPIETPNDVYRLFGAGGLPYYGEPFPGQGNLGAIDWNIERVDGHNGLWRVTWEYQEVRFGFRTIVPPVEPAPDEIKDPTAPGYTEISATITASHVDTWRAIDRATIKAMCDPNNGPHRLGQPTMADIGGTRVDSGGHPVSYILRQFEVTIMIVESSFRPDRILPFLWKRNDAPIFYCEAGSVLYCGCTVNRIGVDAYQVHHRFSYDEWYHMRQAPGRDITGEIMLTTHPQNPLLATAEYVHWVQPYPDVTDLKNIDPLIRYRFP